MLHRDRGRRPEHLAVHDAKIGDIDLDRIVFARHGCSLALLEPCEVIHNVDQALFESGSRLQVLVPRYRAFFIELGLAV